MKLLKRVIKVCMVAVLAVAVLTGCGGSDEEVKYSFPIEAPFTTNLRGSRKYIKANIVIEYSEKNQEKFLTENLHKINDAILYALRSKTEEDVAAEDFDTELKISLTDQLNQMLEVDFITNIYFNELVIQ